jgi:predicted Zn-ribbon and HTH transcriptional regulator
MEEYKKMSEPKTEVLAWVSTSCRFCGWTGKVEVIEKDANGKLVVRCPQCKERINVE